MTRCPTIIRIQMFPGLPNRSLVLLALRGSHYVACNLLSESLNMTSVAHFISWPTNTLMTPGTRCAKYVRDCEPQAKRKPFFRVRKPPLKCD
jgi:hypothetical protein